jgi:hypothetical protein
MFKILIDTCVWLDLAKDYQRQSVLGVLDAFHRQRNGIDDAILIEVYADLVKSRKPGDRFAFVTHNTKDFSQPNANHKLPHPDMEVCFSKIPSRYDINLTEALRHVAPALVSDLMIEEEWEQEPRRLGEISGAISELLDKVWHNRHEVRLEKVESGEIKIVEKETAEDRRGRERTCQRDIWKVPGNPRAKWKKATD